MKKDRTIKAWTIVNKFTDYPIWEFGQYLIYPFESWAGDNKFRKYNKFDKKREKIVPVEIKLERETK